MKGIDFRKFSRGVAPFLVSGAAGLLSYRIMKNMPNLNELDYAARASSGIFLGMISGLATIPFVWMDYNKEIEDYREFLEAAVWIYEHHSKEDYLRFIHLGREECGMMNKEAEVIEQEALVSRKKVRYDSRFVREVISSFIRNLDALDFEIEKEMPGSIASSIVTREVNLLQRFRGATRNAEKRLGLEKRVRELRAHQLSSAASPQ